MIGSLLCEECCQAQLKTLKVCVQRFEANSATHVTATVLTLPDRFLLGVFIRDNVLMNFCPRRLLSNGSLCVTSLAVSRPWQVGGRGLRPRCSLAVFSAPSSN